MTDPYDRLVAEGETVLEEWCSDGREEDLYLEFKQSSGSGPSLSTDDKKNLYRAVSAFANADGGMVVWGVRTERTSGVDRAAELKPISDIEKFRARLLDCLSNATSPPVDGIEVVTIASATEPGRGFVVMRIPTSTRRPHQASIHQRYFRRGSTGSRIMEHSEVREMMLAGTHAKLSVEYQVREFITVDKIVKLNLQLSLRNQSGIMTAYPYLLVGKPVTPYLVNLLGGTPTSHPDGYGGIYGGADRIVHAYDVLPMASVLFSAKVSGGEVVGMTIGHGENWKRASTFALPELDLKFGGQNAHPDTERRTWTGPELIREARAFIEPLI